VVYVRMQKCGVRFEIACYPNKVDEWRRQVETELDQVLQTPHIYNNVSQGQLANNSDLKKAFGTTDSKKISLEILDKGEIQISGEERKETVTKLYKDVAQIIAEKCINSETKEALTTTTVEKAMKECHVSLVPNKTAKQQALVVIKLLMENSSLPIERAKMRLQLSLPTPSYELLKEQVNKLLISTESVEDRDGMTTVVCLIEPSVFREIDQLIKKDGKTEVLTHSVKPVAVHEF